MRHKEKLISNILLATGGAFVLAGLILFGVNRYEGNKAYAMSMEKIEQVKDEAARRAAESHVPEMNLNLDEVDPEATLDMVPEEPKKVLPVVEIDGYLYDGYLTIPAIELEMPVTDNCDEDNLKYFLCRYSGDPYEGGMIIAGHNYKKSFRKLRDLAVGDEILFTTMDGEQFLYTVSEIEVIDGKGIDEMIDPEWDLTLFTCTFGGQERYTVRCMSAD